MRVSVPETTVHKHHSFAPWKDNIWPSRQFLYMESQTISELAKH